ncbi:MAG: di-trans,poly-cis-decaprenylcistransferase [Clostridia bacterium]|nr:di-trans,poly-cis-decaprenylcistransferase [Clostridia bacterium]
MQNGKSMPRHVGFIMDGNGRWAKKQNKPRNFGHSAGADRVKDVVLWSFESGIECVTLYAFSSENWGRPKEEVDKILELLVKFLKNYSSSLVENKIRLVVSGDLSVLSSSLQTAINSTTKKTENFTEKTLNIALNYGGRQEIVEAVNSLVRKGKEISVNNVSEELGAYGIPDLDLVVRTSGEQRISNFYLWQIAYAELYFTDALWPEFDKAEFDKAINWYLGRERRFGKL